MEDRIKELLDEIRPMLQADGGDIEFISFDSSTGIVKVKLVGTCGGCPYAQYTIKMGVERYIKEKIPEVKEVDAV
ncbi:MAG: NifU family protein [Thermoplasmata archaeon]|nr:NifU family protein [Thermoplasmata archaeon]